MLVHSAFQFSTAGKGGNEIRKALPRIKNFHLNFHLPLRVRKYEKILPCLGQEFFPQCYKGKCVRYKLYLFPIITILWQLYIEDTREASCIFVFILLFSQLYTEEVCIFVSELFLD